MSADSEFVLTRSSLLKRGSAEEFECVLYESHKPKKKKTKDEIKGLSKNGKNNIVNVDKVTHEVLKFGIAGMSPEERRAAKTNLLIKLGAKPPKKKSFNYKTLKEQKLEEKLEQEKKANSLPDDPMSLMIAKKKKKKKLTMIERKRNNILEGYGKPGQVQYHGKKKRRN